LGATIDLSAITGGTLIIVNGSAQSIAFNSAVTYRLSDNCGLTCNIIYKLTVTGGPNPGLITLPNELTPTIEFAASDVLGDAGVYTINV
jgi:hypothetical protein